MEGLVRHDELAELHHQGIAALLVEGREGAHGQAFNEHLHADELLPHERTAHEFRQQAAQCGADRRGLAPAGLDVAGETGDMTGLFARLVRCVFLGTRVAQDVAQGGRQGQSPLLSMQD